MEIYWTFTRNDIKYEDIHCQTNFEMTEALFQAYSSDNTGRRRNPWSPCGGETTD